MRGGRLTFSAYLVDVACFVEETLASIVGHLVDDWLAILVVVLLIAAIVWGTRRFVPKSSRVRVLLTNRTFLFTS